MDHKHGNRNLTKELEALAPEIKSVKGIIVVSYINNTIDSYRPRSKDQIIIALKNPDTHFVLKTTMQVSQVAPSGNSLVPYLLTRQNNSSCHIAAQELDAWLQTTHGVSLRDLTTPIALASYKRHLNVTPTYGRETYLWNTESNTEGLAAHGHSYGPRLINRKASDVGVDLEDEASKFLKQHGAL